MFFFFSYFKKVNIKQMPLKSRQNKRKKERKTKKERKKKGYKNAAVT